MCDTRHAAAAAAGAQSEVSSRRGEARRTRMNYSTNRMLCFVLMLAMAALTSFRTTYPRYRRQHAMYLPWRGLHFTIWFAGLKQHHGRLIVPRSSAREAEQRVVLRVFIDDGAVLQVPEVDPPQHLASLQPPDGAGGVDARGTCRYGPTSSLSAKERESREGRSPCGRPFAAVRFPYPADWDPLRSSRRT
ncbi:hypothetical protein EYF80_049779 [Liparis tanakae]|uniref:Uncharacterized protein n=1 Tax=Liparis tanakae TaxID=230148 RepID=A0A4Z2FH03_9TELE|nr:hypothetical protein EYF80_049779 [Liparis tanakae]